MTSSFKTAALIMVIVFIIPVGLYPNRNDIQFGHISVEDGLSQNAVNCIFQDSKGFMWFGTKDGLNKYDGYSFGIYHHDPFDPKTLSDNWVNCISEDRKGNLWIGTKKGINRFNRQTEQFTRFIHNPDIPQGLGNDIINSINVDKEEAIWVGTNGGLDRFDPATEIFTHFRHNPTDSKSLSDNIVLTLYEDKPGLIWVGTNRGLDYFDRETEHFTHIIPNSSNPPRRIESIYKDSKSNLLIIYGNKLHQFESNTQSVIPYKFEPLTPKESVPEGVGSISEDGLARLWIGTMQGLYILDKQNNQLMRYRYSPTDPHSISDDAALCVYTDQSGGLWIGTNGGGINTWNPTLRKFNHYKHEPYNPFSLRVASIRTFYVDQDKHLWIGGYTGLNKYDRKAEKSLRYYLKVLNDINSLSDNLVRVIYEDPLDPHRILWIGTESRGLNKFDRVTEIFKRYDFSTDGSKGLRGGMVFAILRDKSGYLWIGSDRGLNKLSKSKEEFTFYIHDPDDPHSISHNSVSTILEDKLGFLWIGTHGGGLNRFDRKTESFVHFMHNSRDPKSLSHDKVISIYEDHEGTLWVGTDGGGLNRFDRDSETFVQYTKKHGLPNNVIYGILEDEEGDLWLSTNKGLSRFNPQEETFRNYDINDGLQSSEFNYNAYYKSKSGEMFFGGINGFNAFYPKDVKDNPNIPPVVITDFQIFNKSVPAGEDEDGRSILTTSISETEEIQISYKDNVISFEYVALDYAAPEKNEYAYIMEGLENEWNYVGKRRYATYSQLPPGEYTFRVRGSNNDGVWNEEGASINIIISPPFWEMWWFRITGIVAILAFIIGLYKTRTYSIRKKSEQLNEINIRLNEQITERKEADEKIKASLREKEVLLQEIHHRVKNNMQIISSLLKLQSRHIKDERALEIFKSSQNRVLSMASIHDRLYKSKDFARVDFGEYTQGLVISLFKVYGIDPKAIKTDIRIKEVFLNVNTAIPCGLIINELVSNSLKHAFPDDRKGEIRISMHPLKGNEFELIFSDNGIGISEDIDVRNTESLGLHLVTILVEDQLQGEIKLNRDKGSEFQIKMRRAKP